LVSTEVTVVGAAGSAGHPVATGVVKVFLARELVARGAVLENGGHLVAVVVACAQGEGPVAVVVSSHGDEQGRVGSTHNIVEDFVIFCSTDRRERILESLWNGYLTGCSAVP
jgi:hypothetical protein